MNEWRSQGTVDVNKHFVPWRKASVLGDVNNSTQVFNQLKYLNLLKQNEWETEGESEVKQKNHLKLVLQDSAEWGWNLNHCEKHILSSLDNLEKLMHKDTYSCSIFT